MRQAAGSQAGRILSGSFALAGLVLAVGLPLAAQGPQFRVQLPGAEGNILLDTLARRFDLAGPTDKVFAAIDKVFGEFELPATEIDPTLGKLPNRRVVLRRRIGRFAMSRFLDCGRDFSGARADLYRITLAAVAWPEPQTGESRHLRVAIVGSGQDPASSGEHVLCMSTGRFEDEFVKRVANAVVNQP